MKISQAVVLLLSLATSTIVGQTTVSAQTTLRAVQLREQLRIGSVDDGPYALSRVSSLAVDQRSGLVYVALGQESEIRAFSRTGEYVRSLGGPGSGPGEFSRALGRLMLRGDTLVAFDPALSQASYFASTGTHLESIRVQPATLGVGLRPASPVAQLDNGNFVGVPGYSGANAPDGAGTSAPVVELDRSGNVLTTLDRLIRGNRQIFIPASNGDGGVSVLKPVWAESLLSIDPMGSSLLFIHQQIAPDGDAHTFRARRIRADGRVIYERDLGYSPRPVTRELQDSIVGQLRESFEQRGGGVRYDPEELRRAFEFPRFHPPVSLAVLGTDGTAWVRREPIGARVAWWILDATGVAVGTALLPMTTEVLAVFQDEVWTAEYDELQVPYVVRYAVE